MEKNLYKGYVDQLRHILNTGTRRNEFKKGNDYNSFDGIGTSSKTFSVLNEDSDRELYKSLSSLDNMPNTNGNYHLAPGKHPDFSNIQNEHSYEKHYIVSAFIDIKNSTSLFKKYDPSTVVNITNTIQRAAVHTSWRFNGYIQRYHGDGLFVYFGGKEIETKIAVQQALSATSAITYFVKNDLKDLFFEQGIENINTRIGIDVGEAEDVLWYMAGMGNCSEITTCSLHTSLAAKMQGYANSNSIVVGDNIKNTSLLNPQLFNPVKDSNGEIKKKYIFEIPEEKFYYSQWDFNWQNYLKSLSQSSSSNINQIISGNIIVPEKKNLDYLSGQASQIKPWLNEKQYK
jgi:adenylate cyclase